MSSVYDFAAKTLEGEEIRLERFKGKVLLIVNTASKCGFTPQYEGLQKLQDNYAEKGFSVLGFPCNQFGGQEPGNSSEIGEFCQTKFHVAFPMFEKVEVNGTDAHPLYKFLTSEKSGLLGTKAIKWNFTKFLVDQSGKVIGRYGPGVKPEELSSNIQKLLEEH